MKKCMCRLFCFIVFVILGSISISSYAQKPLKRPSRSERLTNSSDFVLSVDGQEKGHEYVDLGLSVKWATCNVGAESPGSYGDYYAWGESAPKSDYKNLEISEDSIIGKLAYDAAYATWNGGWRLPTYDEMIELKDNCTHIWITYQGVQGYLFTSKLNGHTIFLPAAGYKKRTSFEEVGTYGFYWSGSPRDKNRAYGIGFDKGHFGFGWDNRSHGHSIRPVRN